MHSSDTPTARDVSRRDGFTKGMLAPFFIYSRDAMRDEGMPVVLAVDAEDAVRDALGSTAVLCSVSIGQGDHSPDAPAVGPLEVLCLRDGRCVLLARGSWPAPTTMSHGTLWSSLSSQVRGMVKAQWASFATMGDKLDQVPR